MLLENKNGKINGVCPHFYEAGDHRAGTDRHRVVARAPARRQPALLPGGAIELAGRADLYRGAGFHPGAPGLRRGERALSRAGEGSVQAVPGRPGALRAPPGRPGACPLRRRAAAAPPGVCPGAAHGHRRPARIGEDDLRVYRRRHGEARPALRRLRLPLDERLNQGLCVVVLVVPPDAAAATATAAAEIAIAVPTLTPVAVPATATEPPPAPVAAPPAAGACATCAAPAGLAGGVVLCATARLDAASNTKPSFNLRPMNPPSLLYSLTALARNHSPDLAYSPALLMAIPR